MTTGETGEHSHSAAAEQLALLRRNGSTDVVGRSVRLVVCLIGAAFVAWFCLFSTVGTGSTSASDSMLVRVPEQALPQSADVALVSKAMHKEKKNEGDDGVTQAQLKALEKRLMEKMDEVVTAVKQQSEQEKQLAAQQRRDQEKKQEEEEKRKQEEEKRKQEEQRKQEELEKKKQQEAEEERARQEQALVGKVMTPGKTAMKDGAKNPIVEWVDGYKKGPALSKWVKYFDAYHEHFAKFRDQDEVVLIEVGIQSGGSIKMWRDYFGKDKLRYYGIDINPLTKIREEPGVEITIGSQDNATFWQEFKKTHPIADIFIDDGGHTMTQQLVTLDEMFWHVRDGGMYLCEDLHTSYWDGFGAGYHDPASFIERSKLLIDSINAWHSRTNDFNVDKWTRSVRGLYFYDSMLFLDKQKVPEPTEVHTGDDFVPTEWEGKKKRMMRTAAGR